MKRAGGIFLAAWLVAWAAISLPSGAAGSQEFDPKLVAAAKAEGVVVYYTSMNRVVSNRVVGAFTKKFGIEVKHVRKGTNQVIQMIEAERQAGIKRVDVFSFSDPAMMSRWRDEGRLLAYQPPWADKFEKRFRDPKGVLVPLFPLMLVFGYNKAAIPPAQAPQAWADLTHPRWKGMIAHSDPSYSGSTAMTVFTLKERFGWDYYRKLAANKPLMVQSIGAVPKLMSTKEAPLAALALDQYLWAQIHQGQPFSIVYPKEGAITYVHYAAIPKTVPHPNAARLFVAFYTSRENQAFLTRMPEALYPSRTDVPPRAGVPPLSSLNLIEIDFAKFRKEKKSVIETFKKIMQR